MNKQELIDKLRRHLTVMSEIKESEYDKGYNWATKQYLAMIADLDEPEKPVVPQCVGDFISSEQRSCSTLSEAIDNMDMRDEGEVTSWFYDNSETFAKAWLFGYEVEKEKLYTAKLKLTNEYLGYESQFKSLLHYIVPDSSAKEVKAYHFTEDVLVKYHIWGSNAYEVKEVEE